MLKFFFDIYNCRGLVAERFPELATVPGDVVHGSVLRLAVRLPARSQGHQCQLPAQDLHHHR